MNMLKDNLTEVSSGFSQYLEFYRQLVEERLALYLSEDNPHILWESMRYSVLSGGKRLRSILCLTAAEAVARTVPVETIRNIVLPCSCAIEMIHAMSLIHDDLPALDNDEYRRGKLTNHKVFGEAVALLAGDALLLYASEILLTKTPETVDRGTLAALAADFARACGPSGMVAGQISDLAFTGNLSEVRNGSGCSDVGILETIHRAKTGALIRFSVCSGAVLMEATAAELALLGDFADVLGLAFQIADDLLDVTGSIKSIGKTPGKDLAANKVTWVTVHGAAGAKQRLEELEENGLGILDRAKFKPEPSLHLENLLKYAIHRTN
jgi:geranylgeranyl diphosphate synthase type II